MFRNSVVTVAAIFLLSIFTTSCSAGPPLLLVENGASTYRIVIPGNARPDEKKAAEVLQHYIHRMTGAMLPVVPEGNFEGTTAIYIGKVKNAGNPGARYDGFQIRTDASAVYICGASGKGTLYGVYTFLEKYLGCRKYAGGEPAFVPVQKDIAIASGIRDVQSPQFVFRQTYYPASNDPEYLDWHKLHRFEDLWGLWGHSYFKLLPPEQHFAAHPEYYSLVQGRRRPVQLCLSNEDVFRHTVAYLRKAMQQRPDAIYWSVSPNDEPLYCTCDQCAATDAEEGGPQGSLIRFVNRVAAVFPDQHFTTLAYTYTSRPPRKTRPAQNVYVFLSSIDAWRTKPLSSEPSAAGFRKNLEEWSAITDHLFIWDYTTQFTNFLTPFPDYRHAAQNLRYFSKKGVSGVFLHGSEDNYSDMAEWNSYLHARLLWDPETDEAAVRADFMTGYYGAAANAVNNYLDVLYEAVGASGATLDIYGNPVNNHSDYLSPERIDRYSSLLDEAEAAVEKDPVRELRVARARLPLEYVVLQQSAFYGTQRYGYLSGDDNGEYQMRKNWPERVTRFAAQAEAAGVRELSEGGITPAVYEKEWKELLARSWKRNRAEDADISFRYPFSPDYPARGSATLIDGLHGSKDYSYNWLLFYGHDMEVTIDLGNIVALRTVTAGFLHDPKHYIFLPLSVTIEVSEDGSEYRTVSKKLMPVRDEDFDVVLPQYLFTLPSGTKARFLRVTAVCPAGLPAWRFHERKKPAVACDEIMVE